MITTMDKTERFKVFGAVFLVLRRGDQILLQRRANTGWHDGEYTVVSGHINGRESFTTALCREAKEEAGISIDPFDVRCVHIMNRHDTGDHREYVDMYFEVSTWDGEVINAEPDKCDDIRWFAMDALPDNIVPAAREALVAYGKGMTYSEFGWE
jgi:8-oxo-dGTP pyrophosphatase MutT (NUDIX family)